MNTAIAGLYILSYSYTDTYGNPSVVLRRNVTVAALADIPFAMVGGGGGA